jgi:hypothetical protein
MFGFFPSARLVAEVLVLDLWYYDGFNPSMKLKPLVPKFGKNLGSVA